MKTNIKGLLIWPHSAPLQSFIRIQSILFEPCLQTEKHTHKPYQKHNLLKGEKKTDKPAHKPGEQHINNDDLENKNSTFTLRPRGLIITP